MAAELLGYYYTFVFLTPNHFTLHLLICSPYWIIPHQKSEAIGVDQAPT